MNITTIFRREFFESSDRQQHVRSVGRETSEWYWYWYSAMNERASHSQTILRDYML